MRKILVIAWGLLEAAGFIGLWVVITIAALDTVIPKIIIADNTLGGMLSILIIIWGLIWMAVKFIQLQCERRKPSS